MDDMESKLGAILSNPAMMQQIMALAQNFGQSTPAPETPKQESVPDVDFTAIQKLAGLTAGSKLSKNQQNLLIALRPYLSHQRINRLEKAMQAAKLAGVATSLLGTAR